MKDTLKAKIIWWLGLVLGAIALYLRVFLSDLPMWSLWIMAYLFASFYAYWVGCARVSTAFNRQQ
jgi:hypothetical protein